MYIQNSPTTFLFSTKEILPNCKFGEYPELDKLAITIHLTSSYMYDDEEVINWIKENSMEYISEQVAPSRFRTIKFTNIEDAMAFKLRWC